jgi:hypothetical protein
MQVSVQAGREGNLLPERLRQFGALRRTIHFCNGNIVLSITQYFFVRSAPPDADCWQNAVSAFCAAHEDPDFMFELREANSMALPQRRNHGQ